MPISVKCFDCGKALKAPEALAGKKAKCPDCGAVVPIPKPVMDAEEISDEPSLLPKSRSTVVDDDHDSTFDDVADDEADAPAAANDRRKSCPMCGEQIAASAAKCRFCGEVLDSRIRSRHRRQGSDEYAGFWLRFVASLIDGFILAIVMFVVVLVLGGILVAINGNGGGNGGPAEAIVGFIIWGFMIVLPWLYSAFQESSPTQATLGKKMLGIRVTDLEGNRVSFGQASGRHFGKILSNMVCSIGFLMAGFTEKKQALHDMLASTLIVRD